MMLPGQEKAMKEYAKRKADGHDEQLSLVLLFEAGFQQGQTTFVEVMNHEKDRCPICGNRSE